MKVCVVGLGYIGLPTSAVFAKYGADVVGVDNNESVVFSVNLGKVHLKEPYLEELVKEMVDKNRLKASLIPEEADVFIIAVPTPSRNDKYKSCDLKFVQQAVEQVIPYLRPGNIVIVESTIAPRSMEDQVKPRLEKAGFEIGKDIYLVHCPERVLPGQIMYEIIHNNRIIGGVTEACAKAGAEVYSLFVKGEIVQTDVKTAEMSKLMENTFRDVNIALVNELTKVCNNLGINVLDVIEMANKHPRVNLHQPGPGVGGHCLAVDPYFIVEKSPDLAKIIKLSRETNTGMPKYIVEKVSQLLRGLDNAKIAVFGVSYKADVNDIRESPAIEIINLLIVQGYNVSIHDPFVDSVELPLTSAKKATEQADMILLLTDHSVFKTYSFNVLAVNMKNPVMFDTKNCVKPELLQNIKVINFGNLFEYTSSRESVMAI